MTDKKLKVFVSHAGVCYRRELDSYRVRDYFKLNGAVLVDNPNSADVMILTTCGYKEQTEHACLQQIKTLSRFPGELIVMGCLPGIAPTNLKKIFKGRYFSTKDINKIDSAFPSFKIKMKDVQESNFLRDDYLPKTKEFYDSKNENVGKIAILRVGKSIFANQEDEMAIPIITCCKGCNWGCSYCGIYHAIGRVVSKPIEKILDEYKRLLNAGYTKVRFTGDEVGNYGEDINLDFSVLLDAIYSIDKQAGTEWFINDVHPRYALKFKDKFSKYINLGKIKSLQVMVQSGSDKILSLMNRGYKSDEIKKCLKEFKRINPNLSIVTHMIVGFPGETEKDFSDSISFLNEIDANGAQFFSFSPREGTLAYDMDNKLHESIIQKRLKYIIELYGKNNVEIIAESNCAALGKRYDYYLKT